MYVAGSNKIYLGLYIEGPIFLSDFNQIRSFSTDFHKIIQKTNFTEICPAGTASVHAERRSDGRARN